MILLTLVGNLIFAVLILVFSLRLVSKKHHCEKLSFLVYLLLFFLCAADLQLNVFNPEAVRLFWYTALGLGGVLLGYFNFSPKTRYYIKDLDLRREEQLGALEMLVRDYVRYNLEPGAVEFSYRNLTFYKVPEDKQKELVGLIDEYIDENDCSDMKDWRFMIIFAVTVQIVFLLLVFFYKLWIYF